jgi:hypothetical protein
LIDPNFDISHCFEVGVGSALAFLESSDLPLTIERFMLWLAQLLAYNLIEGKTASADLLCFDPHFGVWVMFQTGRLHARLRVGSTSWCGSSHAVSAAMCRG